MNKLLYLLFLSVFFLDFFHFELGIIPRSATWLPEILAILTCLVIALRFTTLKEKPAINPKYVTLLLLYFTIILIGIVLNTTPPESIIAGIRAYFKHLPFFLLPAVYDFSEEQFKKQLQFVLSLLILQCPLAVYQRFFQFRGVMTGDVIAGTLEVSSVLSITMICSIAVIFALHLKKRIGFKLFLIIVFCLFLPTTLNETKGTLVLLPLAFLIPAFFLQGKGSSRAKSLLITALISILFISAFVPIYDHFMRPRLGYSILDFFQNKDKVTEYLYRGTREGDTKKIMRGDAIVLTYKNLSDNPLRFTFGHGIGNLIRSYFEFLDEKSDEAFRTGADRLALTNLFWEFGLLGIAVCITFMVFLFRDAVLLRKSDDIFGSFALGWSAVVVIICFSLAYKNIIHFNVINFMFWYFSGVIAAKIFRMRAL